MEQRRDVIVSVRFPESDLRKLQLIGQVTEQSAGSIIRTAVSEHIKSVANEAGFQDKATKLKRATDELLAELLKSDSK